MAASAELGGAAHAARPAGAPAPAAAVLGAMAASAELGGAPPPDAARAQAAAALEEAVEQLGPFGLYQRYSLALLCLPSVLAAMYSLNYIFIADQVPFRCVVPECEGAGGAFLNATVSALLPPERCRRFQPANRSAAAGACARDHYHPADTVPCDQFVYEHYETIYSEFGLACREWLRTLLGTLRNTALPISLVITGYLSDTYGRRTALCVFAACAGVLGMLKGFSVNYPMYLTLEFLEAALGYGFNSAAYVMMVELARPPQRAAFACATGVAYGAGGVLLSLAAWRARSWRHLLWVLYAPALLLPLYWLLLDESWRWLAARGRPARAAALLRKAARWNKVTLDEATLQKLGDEELPSKQAEDAPAPGVWRTLLRSRVLRVRFAVCAWCWVAAAFVYYGLTINSVSLSGDKYVNFALNMLMEVVASLLLMMALERFGRKWSICAAFLLCGVACVTPFFFEHSGAALGLFFVGKLAITFAFNSLYVYSAELFPTATRSSALAACSLVGRLGSILAPQTPLLSAAVQALLYGACAALAAAAVALVPETRRAPLPHDVAAAERMRAPPAPAPPAAPPPPPPRRVLSVDS